MEASTTPIDADLIHRIYAALYDSARYFFTRERVSHTLGPTALVNEYFTKVLGKGWQHEAEADFDLFRRGAVRKLDQLLKDHARVKTAKKRGKQWSRVRIDLTALARRSDISIDMKLDVEEILEQLAACPSGTRMAKGWRLFRQDGFSLQEVVDLLRADGFRCSLSTLKRDIQQADALIRERLCDYDE